MRRALAFGAVALMVALWVATAPPAAAHPLGNFTVNHYDGLRIETSRIVNAAVVDWAEIPTSQLETTVDSDGDGQASEAERAGFAARRCADVAGAQEVRVDGEPSVFRTERSSFDFRPGVAGLRTARLSCRLVAEAELGDAATVVFRDRFEEHRIGWREITATGVGVHLVRSPVPSRSVSDELRRYPDDLLSSPLDVREATLVVRPGPGVGSASPHGVAVASPGLADRTVGRITARFNDLVGRKDLTFGVGFLAVALSLLLGASHAVLPGHGKTVMAAYLAGRQGSARDAVLVGATVTVTHTAGVLVLGVALSLSTTLAGDVVLAWLGVASGALVALLGATLLSGALRAGHGGRAKDPEDDGHPHPDADHHHHHRHHHQHDQHHGSEASAVGAGRRGLVAMGVAGGLVPSPSALVVLLAAIALGRTAFGVVLVLAYGIGMAATLTVVGLLLVRFRDRVTQRGVSGRAPLARVARRWANAVPVATASLVMIVGVGLAARSLGGV